MKYKIGFRLDWLEMIMILAMIFFAGILTTSKIESKFILVGLLILGAGIILNTKRVKIPLKNKAE